MRLVEDIPQTFQTAARERAIRKSGAGPDRVRFTTKGGTGHIGDPDGGPQPGAERGGRFVLHQVPAYGILATTP